MCSPEKVGLNQSFHYLFFVFWSEELHDSVKEAKKAKTFSVVPPCLAHPWLLILLLADITASSAFYKLSQ